MSGVVSFHSDDLGLTFDLDERFVQAPPVSYPPSVHVVSAHFTLSVPGQWLAAFNVIEARSPHPVVTLEDLGREVDAFLAMQQSWDLKRTQILEPCHADALGGLPAWRTVHIIRPPSPGEPDYDADALRVPVYTQQHALFDGRRRIHMDLTVLPPERYEQERETLDRPFVTLEVARRG